MRGMHQKQRELHHARALQKGEDMERTELKVLRIKHKMTQKDVAQKLGISIAAYSFIESGKRNGSIETWSKLQKIYNLTGEETWNLMHQDQQERKATK